MYIERNFNGNKWQVPGIVSNEFNLLNIFSNKIRIECFLKKRYVQTSLSKREIPVHDRHVKNINLHTKKLIHTGTREKSFAFIAIDLISKSGNLYMRPILSRGAGQTKQGSNPSFIGFVLTG